MSRPTFGSIVRNNLLILLAAAVLLGLAGKLVSEAAIMLFGALFLGQVAVNILLGLSHVFSKDPHAQSAPYFLSALLVLLVGFGACAGMLSIVPLNLH